MHNEIYVKSFCLSSWTRPLLEIVLKQMDTDVILENALNRQKMFFFYYKSIPGGKEIQ